MANRLDQADACLLTTECCTRDGKVGAVGQLAMELSVISVGDHDQRAFTAGHGPRGALRLSGDHELIGHFWSASVSHKMSFVLFGSDAALALEHLQPLFANLNRWPRSISIDLPSVTSMLRCGSGA